MSLLFAFLASVSIFKICIVILVVGFLIWLITTLVPLNPIVQKIFIAVAIIGLAIWVLKATGLLAGTF